MLEDSLHASSCYTATFKWHLLIIQQQTVQRYLVDNIFFCISVNLLTESNIILKDQTFKVHHEINTL